MASKIGDVLKIETANLYMKGPVGPMITMETHDISKLTSYICIPSMAKRVNAKDTTPQRIMYSSLPNQCRKCCQFRHFTRTCTVPRAPIWDESAPTSNFPTWSKIVAQCCNPNLGLVTKARACNRMKQEGNPGGTSYTPKSARECERMNPHSPKATPTWGVGILRVPKDSQIFREWLQGPKPIDLKSFFYHWKDLKCGCLKWTHITHLDIWNTSYGQKKSRKSNWQFDSRPLKVRNRPDFHVCRWRATYCRKALNEGYIFALNLIAIKGLHTKLWGAKVTGVLTLVIWGLPLGSPETKSHLDVGLVNIL